MARPWRDDFDGQIKLLESCSPRPPESYPGEPSEIRGPKVADKLLRRPRLGETPEGGPILGHVLQSLANMWPSSKQIGRSRQLSTMVGQHVAVLGRICRSTVGQLVPEALMGNSAKNSEFAKFTGGNFSGQMASICSASCGLPRSALRRSPAQCVRDGRLRRRRGAVNSAQLGLGSSEFGSCST